MLKGPPEISIIVLTYNSAKWIGHCLDSIFTQLDSPSFEVIVVDNGSIDGTQDIVKNNYKEALLVSPGFNAGYTGGNNYGATYAFGKWLFFLNPDTHLEPDCLWKLLFHCEEQGFMIAQPLVLDYDSDKVQSAGYAGFDIFGMPSPVHRFYQQSKYYYYSRKIAVASGCSLFIDAELFKAVGEFDNFYFMYNDEVDLSYRCWIAGADIALVDSAIVHHYQGACVDEARTNKTTPWVRYQNNKNGLKTLYKIGGFMRLFVPSYLFLTFLDSILLVLLTRNLSFLTFSYFAAVYDASFRYAFEPIKFKRNRSTFKFILKFFRLYPSRLESVQRALRRGLPKY